MATNAAGVAAAGFNAAARIFDGGGSSSEIAARRLEITEEDRELETSRLELQDIVNSLNKDALTVATHFTSGNQDPKALKDMLAGLSAQAVGAEASNPFPEDLSGKHPNDALGAWGESMGRSVESSKRYKDIVAKGGRHKLLAIDTLRNWKSNVRGQISTTSSSATVGGEGGPRREEQLTTTLSQLTGRGKLREVSKKTTKGVTRTIPDGNTGGTKDVEVGDKVNATKALMGIGLNTHIKSGSVFASIGGEHGPLIELMTLDEEIVGLGKMGRDVRNAIGVTTSGDSKSVTNLENSLSDTERDLPVSKMLGHREKIDSIVNGLSNGKDIALDLFNDSVENMTKQIKSKSDRLEEVSDTFLKRMEYFVTRGGLKTGVVDLPKIDDPNNVVPKFLSDISPEFFNSKDNKLTKGEFIIDIRRFLNSIASESGKENLRFSSVLQYNFGREIATPESIKSLLDYNSSVNNKFVEAGESLIKQLEDSKGEGDTLDVALNTIAKLKATLGVEKAKAELAFGLKYPFVFTKELENAVIVGNGQAEMAKLIAKMTGNIDKGEVDPLMVMKYNIGVVQGIEQTLKGNASNPIVLSAYDETLKELVDIHMPRLKELDKRSAGGDEVATNAKKKMFKNLGPVLAQSFVSGQSTYIANAKEIEAKINALTKKMEDGLNPRETKLLQIMNLSSILFSPESGRMEGFLQQLGFTPEQLELIKSTSQRTEAAVNDVLKRRQAK